MAKMASQRTAFTHFPCLLASEENLKAFDDKLEHSWNICILVEHRRQCGWAEDTEALGNKCFLHGSSPSVPHSHSYSQAPPSQLAPAGMCAAGSWHDLSWGGCSHEFIGSGNSSASGFTEEEATTHSGHPNSFARPLQHRMSYQTQI